MASAIDLEKKELRAQVRRQLNAMTDRERRESDAACIDRITRFLEQCGVPVASIPPSWYDQISEKT